MFHLPKVSLPTIPNPTNNIQLPKIPSLPHIDLNSVINKVGGSGTNAYEKILNAFKKFSSDGQTVKFYYYANYSAFFFKS